MSENPLAAMARMAKEEQAEEPKENVLGVLSDMLEHLKMLQADVDFHETQLEEAKASLRQYEEKVIPDYMDSVELSNVTTKDGAAISVKETYKPSIKVADRPAVFEWMREHDFGDMIKTECTIRLKKEEHKKEVLDLMEERGETFALNESVHHSTLASWVNKQITDGGELPEEISTYLHRKVHLKAKQSERRRNNG